MRNLPPSEVGADEARDAADRVLAGRAYTEANRPPSLQERVFDWIADVFGELFGALSSAGGRGPVAWVIVAIFAALIIFLVSKLVGNWGPLPKRAVEQGPVIDISSDRSIDEWLAAAIAAEADGDWRQAVRCRHRALVTSLVARRVVTARPGQTAGEIQREASAARPDVETELQQATWLFKDVWYGWQEAGPESSREFAALSESVLATLATTPSQAVSV